LNIFDIIVEVCCENAERSHGNSQLADLPLAMMALFVMMAPMHDE